MGSCVFCAPLNRYISQHIGRCVARHIRVVYKFFSSRRFVISRRFWVRRTHTRGFSPSFIGGLGPCFLENFWKLECWKKHFLAFWAMKLRHLRNELSTSLHNRVVYKSRQPAKFAGFSARFRRLLSLLQAKISQGNDVYQV